jgi:hypothetical protein
LADFAPDAPSDYPPPFAHNQHPRGRHPTCFVLGREALIVYQVVDRNVHNISIGVGRRELENRRLRVVKSFSARRQHILPVETTQ